MSSLEVRVQKIEISEQKKKKAPRVGVGSVASKTNILQVERHRLREAHQWVPDTVGLETYPRHSYKIRIKDLHASRDGSMAWPQRDPGPKLEARRCRAIFKPSQRSGNRSTHVFSVMWSFKKKNVFPVSCFSEQLGGICPPRRRVTKD